MKKILLALVWLLLPLQALAADNANAPHEQQTSGYSVAMVKSCGVALAIGDGDNIKQNALQDAKQKAVKKAAARFIAPSEGKESLYQQIVADYDLYIEGDVQILKLQKVEGKLLAFCNVPVNFQMINENIKQKVTTLQKENRRDKAIFLVRVVDMPDILRRQDIKAEVLTRYEEAFKQYNFKALGSDAAGSQIMTMLDAVDGMQQDLAYAAYREQIVRDTQQMPELNLVVVGEIKITQASEYADGTAYAEAVRLLQDGYRQIGSFSDTYSATRHDLGQAVEFVAQAAAVRSAKYLADMTYNDWQKLN
ncbi:MAG: hypothetical protein Q4E64_06425 [Phascolarctobacterium sp.]|uniref:hypothetical protein n=1 Tax=Phascolarctobacterium sp. TaxID=2049039 RepID=UPI0026DA8B5A|nr:hypothetical protein [Phascolarctobacterium sp.]MDO4921442.1 hypothetical protein [Phascolarctobacterium sp.]